jgi:RNA polymerase sigma-70 factor, ECF subfamily
MVMHAGLIGPRSRAAPAVVTALADSPATGFDDAVSSHRAYLLRLARQRLRDAASAEDLVQDTLLAAWQGAPRFARRASLRTWLTAILLRRMADHLRRAQRSGRVERDAAAASAADAQAAHDGGAVPASAIDWRDPERVLASQQSLRVVQSCLATLSDIASRVFMLREVEGLDNDDAARRLGIDARRCALILHRTRARLRGCLQLAGDDGNLASARA